MARAAAARPDLPSGTVTFLFTDIEGSTTWWAQDGAGMGASLRVHDETLRAAVAEHDGHVFSTGGDGFGVAFRRASDAVAAAAAAQERLAAVEWPGPALRVRMGLHLGETEERGGDYFGPAVNITARVTGAAHGGQVLVTSLVLAALRAPVEVRSLGSIRLRGVPEPVDVSQLGLEAFPPLRSKGGSRPAVLPVFRTSLVGRDADVDELTDVLRERALVTVTGSGGAGKTRLAVEVASRSTAAFPDGVWFVDLSSAEDDAGITGALMEALDLSPMGGVASLGQIVDYLRDRQGLLVVDNCEHLADAAAAVVEAVVTGAAGMRVLTTSREVLGVEGEIVWRIPSLPTGPDSAAATLFLDRARAVGWTGDADPTVVGEICERLDGIPLAIELAAARARSMPVAEIRDRLDDRFRLLSGGARRSRRRQQTLEATVQWSYDLLDPEEQQFLQVLGVFLGGFRIDDAAAVAGLDEWEAIELVDSLVAKSMVQPAVDQGSARCRLLETVRLFALDRLVESGRSREVRDAHLDRFVSELVTAPFLLVGPHLRAAADYDNLLSAGQWAIESGRPADAARLAITAAEDFTGRGALDTAMAWLDCDTGLSDAERVRCEALLAHLAWYRLDLEAVAGHASAAIELGDGRAVDGLPLAFITCTYAAALEHDFDRIEPSLDAAETAARRLDEPNPSLALVAVVRAAWATAWGDFEGAVEHARHCVALAPQLYSRSVAESHGMVALLALGRTAEAREAFATAVPSPTSSPARHLTDIVEMMIEGRDDPEGAAVRGARFAAAQARRHPHTVGDWLMGFGWLAYWRGELDLAEELSRNTPSLFLPSSALLAAIEQWDPARRRELLDHFWPSQFGGQVSSDPATELFAREIDRWS